MGSSRFCTELHPPETPMRRCAGRGRLAGRKRFPPASRCERLQAPVRTAFGGADATGSPRVGLECSRGRAGFLDSSLEPDIESASRASASDRLILPGISRSSIEPEAALLCRGAPKRHESSLRSCRFSGSCDQNITAFGVERGYGVTERGIINRGLTMKKFLIATAALASVALVAPANAADLPVKAPPMVMPALYNWNGLYIGVETGAVMGQKTKWFVNEASTDDFSLDLGHPLHGGFVGGEVGINWQAPGSRWVFGIEGDGNWSELEESLTCEPDDNLAANCGSRISSFATVRGRIGYALTPTGSFLVYVTGGGVWAHQSARVSTLLVPFATFEQWQNTWGWTVGIGAEYGITPWLSLKGEVLFVDLAGKDYDFLGCTIGCPDDVVTIKHNFVLARMGLNWRFNWGKGKGPGPVVARY
jgi:outer membrane immunogenic protein